MKTPQEVLAENLYSVMEDAGWSRPTEEFVAKLIAALNKEGYLIVHREPTPEMIDSIRPYDEDAETVWRRMIDAAPKP